MKLVIWSDFACPYCYIGEERLKKAIEELKLQNKVDIEYRAFELDPYSSKEVVSDTPSRFARKYGMTPEQALHQIEQIELAGRGEGIDFKYRTANYTNTFDAHRLMKLAQSKHDRELIEKLNQLLFDAYFTKNLKLADPEVLLKIGKEAGLDSGEIKEVLSTDKFANEVRQDEKDAALRGVHGVPYFWLEGVFAIPGAVPLNQMKEILSNAVKSQKITAEKGQTCGINGCEI